MPQVSALDAVVVALATHRLTHLVIGDKITERPREWLWKKLGANRGFGYVLTCPWCSSIYVAAVCVGLLVQGGEIAFFVLLGLAASTVAVLIESIVEALDG